VVVTAVGLERVISRNSTLVRDVTKRTGTRAVIEGDKVAQWTNGAHLVAVRAIGRIREGKDNGGLVRLQLVASESCREYDCLDWLKLPVRLSDGQMP